MTLRQAIACLGKPQSGSMKEARLMVDSAGEKHKGAFMRIQTVQKARLWELTYIYGIICSKIKANIESVVACEKNV